MHKKILSLLFLLLSASALQAQEVYNFVLESAQRIINNPASGDTQVSIAQFKNTALVYLKNQAFAQQKEVSEDFLNTQAYYMSEFVALFFSEVVEVQKKGKQVMENTILLFIEASLTHPLFPDTDEETTLCYVNDPASLTRFSLNTDWEKAYEAAKAELKTGKHKK